MSFYRDDRDYTDELRFPTLDLTTRRRGIDNTWIQQQIETLSHDDLVMIVVNVAHALKNGSLVDNVMGWEMDNGWWRARTWATTEPGTLHPPLWGALRPLFELFDPDYRERIYEYMNGPKEEEEEA